MGAFGVVGEQGTVDRIENWQVEDDMVDWKLVGFGWLVEDEWFVAVCE